MGSSLITYRAKLHIEAEVILTIEAKDEHEAEYKAKTGLSIEPLIDEAGLSIDSLWDDDLDATITFIDCRPGEEITFIDLEKSDD